MTVEGFNEDFHGNNNNLMYYALVPYPIDDESGKIIDMETAIKRVKENVQENDLEYPTGVCQHSKI